MIPCILFEDEHLLVVNKPAGWNTHAPSPYASEGIYEWLRNRERRWAPLAIIHRLDKETSGVLVFSKTPLANRSLTEQFTTRAVRKKYLLLTDRPFPGKELVVRSSLVRTGERYASVSADAGGEFAETRFTVIAGLPAGAVPAMQFTTRKKAKPAPACTLLAAEPLTGRTHQIRVHAAENGFPILGDRLYGGTPSARVYLHAGLTSFRHPASGQRVSFSVPGNFEKDPRKLLRQSMLESDATTCCRLVHGAADDRPGCFVDLLGQYLLAQTEKEPDDADLAFWSGLMRANSARAVYHKVLDPRVRRAGQAASPRLVLGRAAAGPFLIRENGLSFEASLEEGYSTGLFLDQRENRRRLLTGYIGPGFSVEPETQTAASGALPSVLHGCADTSRPAANSGASPRLEVLNAFAYTCAFSVCAARAGARTTSLDLSKKHLEWGRRNFRLNGLDPAQHDFIFGDVFDWLRRLGKKGRRFGLILVDPPTFSTSRQRGVFRAEKDYGRLVSAALPLLENKGVLFASCNTAAWPAEAFVDTVVRAIRASGRMVLQQLYIPQPPDFPITRAEPAYLKTLWLRIG